MWVAPSTASSVTRSQDSSPRRSSAVSPTSRWSPKSTSARAPVAQRRAASGPLRSRYSKGAADHLPADVWVVAPQLRRQELSPAARHALQRARHRPRDRSPYEPADAGIAADPVDDTKSPELVRSRERRGEEDERVVKALAQRHLDRDVRAEAVPDDDPTAEPGGALAREPCERLDRDIRRRRS